ncbi:hypothetical protein BC567DRAFT_41210 [Phyllosticta citribraziliensis]
MSLSTFASPRQWPRLFTSSLRHSWGSARRRSTVCWRRGLGCLLRGRKPALFGVCCFSRLLLFCSGYKNLSWRSGGRRHTERPCPQKETTPVQFTPTKSPRATHHVSGTGLLRPTRQNRHASSLLCRLSRFPLHVHGRPAGLLGRLRHLPCRGLACRILGQSGGAQAAAWCTCRRGNFCCLHSHCGAALRYPEVELWDGIL